MKLTNLKRSGKYFVAICMFTGLPIVAESISATELESCYLSVQKQSTTLQDLFDLIEKKFDYSFLIRDKDLNLNERVVVDLEKNSVETILKAVLKNQHADFVVNDKRIIIYKANTMKPGTSGVSQQHQDKRVTVTVFDALGPVIGASVVEKGTTNGGITDMEGKLTLEFQGTSRVIEVSYVGYEKQTIKVASSSVNIELKEDAQALDEVVVVGFGVQKKENLTGAISQVKMNEVLGDRPLANTTQALQGAVPGLFISGNHEPGGTDKKMQIRDAFSLGSGEVIRPLVLIDNVEGDLNMINPNDIDAISVLKDAASTAIYGARAAGGVIIITTKQPKKGEKFSLNYNNNIGFETAINLPQQASLDDYFKMYLEAGFSDSYWAGKQNVAKWKQYLQEYKANPGAFNIVNDGLYKGDDGNVYYLNEKDPYKAFMESSFVMNHNLSASGGTDKVRYRFSGGYTSQDGPLVTSADKYERLNVGAFMSADVTNWFTQVVDIKYSKGTKSMPSGGNLYTTRLISYNPNGTSGDIYGVPDKENLPFNTPLNSILYNNNKSTVTANPRIFLKSIFKPIADLEAVFEYTFDKNDVLYDFYDAKTMFIDLQETPRWNVNQDSNEKKHYFTDYNAFNIYANYSKSFKKHNFKVMAGFNQESSYYEEVQAIVYNQAVPEVPSLGGTTDKTLTKLIDKYSEYTIRGAFFRLNYNYDNKYLVEVNGRYDGSSKFPKESRFGFFPSVSLGWQLGRESFMEATQNWLDELKVRASWGVIGNQNIKPYLYTPSMKLETKNIWLDNDVAVNIIGVPSLVRTNFTWEDVATTDIGLDWAFLSSRLRGSFDWYQRNTTGMLAPGEQLPAIVGASAPYQNTADIRTNGWELAISWRDRIGKVGYSVGFNIADARTKVTKYKNTSGLFYDRNSAQDGKRYREGMYIGEIWGYESDGFYTIDDFQDAVSWKLKEGVTGIDGYTSRLRPGDIKYKNLSDADGTENMITAGAGTIEDPGDRKILGNSSARYQLGANIGVNYAGFDLNIMLQGVGKRDVWLGGSAIFPFGAQGPTDAIYQPVYYNQTDYWSPVDAANGNYNPVNPDAKLPRIYDYTVANSVGSNSRISDKYMQSGAYLRVKNISLSYMFPKQWLTPILVQQLKLFANVENLLTFSSLPKGFDPETLSWSYPAYRTISFGLNVTF